jgi:hypothetical protein
MTLRKPLLKHLNMRLSRARRASLDPFVPRFGNVCSDCRSSFRGYGLGLGGAANSFNQVLNFYGTRTILMMECEISKARLISYRFSVLVSSYRFAAVEVTY